MPLKNKESLAVVAAKPSRPTKAARDSFRLPKGLSEGEVVDTGSVCVLRKPLRPRPEN